MIRPLNEPIASSDFLKTCPLPVNLADLQTFVKVAAIIHFAHKLADVKETFELPPLQMMTVIFQLNEDETMELGNFVLRALDKPEIKPEDLSP